LGPVDVRKPKNFNLDNPTHQRAVVERWLKEVLA